VFEKKEYTILGLAIYLNIHCSNTKQLLPPMMHVVLREEASLAKRKGEVSRSLADNRI
jgi:hypothetical protein